MSHKNPSRKGDKIKYMSNNKELLKRWGENTAYSAKCHFKMSDLNSYWMYLLVSINVLFAVFSIMDFGKEYAWLIRFFSIASLVASILIIIHESRKSTKASLTQKEVGERYLAIHYDIETLYSQAAPSDVDVQKIKEEIKELNLGHKPSVSFLGKWWADYAIEKTGEMNKWWKND